ncbi:helix-turn-helix domain-containing protein [Paenibacillus hemerocallicola]|jgi:AraC-like DNA-binding protein|uniref:Helix-turn-helix domain-containing protein n=2 Tax=Paenibacillus hemerocallicola TaxID=1172614 RepID=A0A5C4T9T4_9BACL|nr:helix-turn-helix domain-containing protein [Paenibacillus hemerocallicola]
MRLIGPIREGGGVMNYEVLESFQPVLTKITERDESMWQRYDYDLLRERTEIHSLAYISDGEGLLELNGARFVLRKGILMYVPPGVRMRITTGKVNMLRYFSVLFHYGELRWEGADGVWQDTTHAALPLNSVYYVEEYPIVLDIYRRMTEIWDGKKPGYMWHCRMEFMQLLHRLMRWMLEDSQEGVRSAALVDSIIVYLRDHLHEPFDRSAVAAKLALSPGYFSVLFKKYTGCTPIEYVTRLRIDRAKQLLMNSDMPVGRIAEEVGYADPLYFTRLFTRETGISPREFRKL